MKKGDKVRGVIGICGLIVILMVVVSAFGGVVSAENVSEDLTKSVADAGIQAVVIDDTANIEFADHSASLGSVHASSSNLGDQAASLAEQVVGAPYLGDGKTYGGKGWDCKNSKFVSSSEIKSGYYFYNNSAKKCMLGQGLDCSGLTFWSYNKAAGATKYQDSSNPIYYEGANGQWTDSARLEQNINKEDLKRGDLLFLIENGKAKHVIMYVGNGYVIHAEGVSFEKIVKEELSTVETRYKNYGYTIGYGRVKAASEPTFNIGDTVRVITNLNVRICAGTDNNVCPEITDPDYPGSAPTGTIGIVLSGPSSANGYIWWEVDYGPGLYSGWSVEGGLEKVIPPTVDAFSVTPDSVTLGNSFTISYTVSDDIGLKQTELWLAIDVGGVPDWGTYPEDNPKQITPLSGQTSYSGSFTEAPPSVGTYWYGMHVVDTADQWSCEPDPPGPIEVEVTQPIQLPQVTTNAASGVGTTSATLNGNLDSTGGEDCQVWFQYGKTTSYSDFLPSKSKSSTGSFSDVLSGLDDDTTYHFRAVASNSEGTAFGDDKTFKTDKEIDPPQATTNAATNVEETTATLNGVISNGGGEACQYRFEYDTNSGEPYAYNTGWTGSKTTGQSFNAAISSLAKGTKYYFRAQAKNSAGTASGSELTFLTKPDAPTSFSASTASTTQIDLSWTKGNGAQKTKIQRKQGSYPSNKDDGAHVYFGTGTSTSDTGLTPSTTYYYRAWTYVQGSEQWSDNYAQASATTTSIDQPQVTTNAASGVGTTSATLNGNLDSTGGEDCQVWFQYGKTTSYSDFLPSKSKSSTGSFSDVVSGLDDDTTYHFRAVASNSEGTAFGDDKTFKTDKELNQPQVTTNVASGIGTTSATLNGNLDSTGGEDCQVWFQYGKTTSYSDFLPSKSKSSTGSFSDVVSGLDDDTTYHFRAVASNSEGTDYGVDNFFMTLEIVDTTPPVWDIMVGIQSATDTGNGGEVTVMYGTATDADSPPVKYNVYYSTSSPATVGTKLSNVSSSPYTVTGLANGQLYYFTVRIEDSATPPNEDTNTVERTATPTLTDTTPPAAITDLATSSPTSNSITLTWTAPGDDGNTGTAASYDIRYSTSTITAANWAAATQVIGEPAPSIAGTAETFTVTGLTSSTTYYFALKTSDEVPNGSPISNSPSDETTIPPSPAGTWNVIGTIPLTGDERPLQIAISGGKAYVGRNPGHLTVIDLSTTEIVTTIPFSPYPGATPGYVAVSGNKAYVALSNLGSDGQVAVININDNTVSTYISVGADPRGVATFDNKVYVTNNVWWASGNPATVKVVDIDTDSVIASISVGINPTSVTVNPVTRKAYVTNHNSLSKSVSVIDTDTNSVVATIPIKDPPAAVAITNNRAYVSTTVNWPSGSVEVIDTSTDNVISSIPVGRDSWGIAASESYVFVANQASDTVSVIDVATNTVVTTLHVGDDPTGVAVDPSTNKVYVTNQGDKTISIIGLRAAPSITSFSPLSPVSNYEGATRTFNITVDQIVNVSWQINGSEVQFNKRVTEASYTNTSAVKGVWNVSAIASNPNGTAMQTWIWNVMEAPALPVHNLHTGENFSTIQAAIDDSDTLSGHTIIVEDGTYTENVEVNKDHLTIQSENGAEKTIVQAANPDDHVFEVTADYVNVSGFTVTGAIGFPQAGIYLVYPVHHCHISDNNVSNNQEGITLFGSTSNNIITNNNVSNNEVGILLAGSNSNTIASNHISNSGQGIDLDNSNNNEITGNLVLNNSDIGISLRYSSNNKVMNNEVSNNYFGIKPWYSSETNITNNEASDNHLGVYLAFSHNTMLTDNIMSRNERNLNIRGDELSHFIQDIDSTNTVNGNPVYYWVNQQDKQIPSDAGFVGLINCGNITAKDLTLTNNGEGVLLANTSNSKIENVSVSNNAYGIYLYSSSNDNTIYLNNFTDNGENVHSSDSTNTWNSPEEITYTYNSNTYTGYLGNYWDDYKGNDTDIDGIGDTPYSIEEDKDYYPLMGTFKNYFKPDTTPPASITNLTNVTGTTWVNWTWTNPPDADFNYTMVYLNGTWKSNTSNSFYNATDLNPDTSYEIGTHTVDKVGNVNETWANQTTKTKIQLPEVITKDASSITSLSATLNGNLDSTGGETCQVWFEWGLTTSYENSTSKQQKSSTGAFSAGISGLSPGTTYYLRAVASNSKGTDYGLDKTFTTGTPTQSNISFDPSEFHIYIGSNAEINLTLDKAPDGLSGYNITITLSNTSIAEIISVSLPTWATLSDNSTIPADSVWMKSADLTDQIKSGATNISLGILTIRGDKGGTSDIIVTVTKMDDDNGYPINPNTIPGQIEVIPVIPLIGHENPPTDPDGDGLYEDLNGNGWKDFNDVVLFFKYMEWIEANEHIPCFDFNGNSRIDFDDIVKLFKEV